MATDSPSWSRRWRSVSTPSASQPLSRYITSNCGAADVAVAATSACGGDGTYSCGADAWPVSVGAHRVQQYQQPAAAGVHHAGLGQHVELPGGLVECDGRGVGGREHHIGQVRAVVGSVLGGARRVLQHRDDGAGNGLAHRA